MVNIFFLTIFRIVLIAFLIYASLSKLLCLPLLVSELYIINKLDHIELLEPGLYIVNKVENKDNLKIKDT
jgi:hypothetical protein